MTNRMYTAPTVAPEWAASRDTDMIVAVAIHAIADDKRSPEAIWEAPTEAEWQHVEMAIEDYVDQGDYEVEAEGYCWGEETIPCHRGVDD